MQQNKRTIDAILKNKPEFEFQIRKIENDLDRWEEKQKYDPETFEDIIYHNDLIDGVKFYFGYTKLIINARNGF